MIIKCISNSQASLDKRLHDFAFSQNDKGELDVTVGKEYSVYGVRENDLGRFYLILTDSVNTELPWWMPADLFKEVDSSTPPSWQKYTWKGYGNETVWANPVYFDAQEDIEDGTDRGFKVFRAMRQEVDAAKA